MNLIKLKEDLFIPSDFAKDNHHYYADEKGEKPYTGITTIISTLAKPALIQWSANEAIKWIKENGQKEVTTDEKECWLVDEEDLEEARVAHCRKKEKAGEHGTDVHSMVEKYIGTCLENTLGSPFEVTAGVPLYDAKIEPFVKWARENVDHFLYSERPVHSKSLFLAGTIDFGAIMKDGTRRVGDLKTGSGIYYESILQTEFYQLLAEEEGDEKYDGSVIVNMRKDGKFDTQIRNRSDIDRDAALGLLAAYRGNATYTKPKK